MTIPPPPAQPQGPAGFGGAPSPGVPGPGTPASTKKSKAPTVLLIAGGVIFLLSVVIGIVLAIIGLGGAAGSITDLQTSPTGQVEVSATEGEEFQIFAEEGAAPPTCTVDGPSVGEGPASSGGVTLGDETWQSFDSFTAEEAGTYTVDCSDGPIAVGPAVSVGGIFTGLAGVLLAIGGGLLGFVLLVIGVILLILRRRKTA